MALVAALFASLLQPACAGPGQNGLSADLLNGVCLTYGEGTVCYNPLTHVWTVNNATARATRNPDGSVTLTTPEGGTLLYKDGQISPAAPRAPPAK